MNHVHVVRAENTKNVVVGNMTDEKKSSKLEITNDVLIADIMLRLTAIETLLLEKGVFTKEEFGATCEEIAKRVAKVVIDKATATKSVDTLTASLLPPKDKKDFNN